MTAIDPLLIVKKQRKKYLVRVLVMIVLNTIGFVFLINDGRTMPERFWVAIQYFLISLPVLGFILGVFVSLIPYRRLSFGQKYVRSSLLVIYIINLIMLVMEIFLIPVRIFGIG